MSFNQFTVKQSAVFPEVVSFTPSAFCDFRGAIYTSYLKDVFTPYLNGEAAFKHDKFIFNKKHVLRGFHGDTKTWKLVSAAYGEIYQVVLDNRPESKTYRQWEAFNLSGANRKMLLVPPRFGNGFCITSEEAVYHYKLAYNGDYVDAKDQFTIKWNDPTLNVHWPINNPILQKRDQ